MLNSDTHRIQLISMGMCRPSGSVRLDSESQKR